MREGTWPRVSDTTHRPQHGVTRSSHICLHFITEMVGFDFSLTLQFTSSSKGKKKKKSNRKQLKSKQELKQAVTLWYRMN